MKTAILSIVLCTFFYSAQAQKFGKTRDITNDFTHKYIEVQYAPGAQQAVIYWGKEDGYIINRNGKKMSFHSHAALFEFLEKRGWRFVTKFSDFGPDKRSRLLFSRVQK